jgi:hypothetical protein
MKIIGLILFILIFSSCTGINTNMIKAADSFVTLSNTATISAEKIASVSCFHVNLIRSSLGSDINLIPSESVAILNKIEAIATQTTPLTCAQKGEILGMWTRFYTKIVLDIIKVKMPELLSLLGSFI